MQKWWHTAVHPVHWQVLVASILHEAHAVDAVVCYQFDDAHKAIVQSMAEDLHVVASPWLRHPLPFASERQAWWIGDYAQDPRGIELMAATRVFTVLLASVQLAGESLPLIPAGWCPYRIGMPLVGPSEVRGGPTDRFDAAQ